MVEQRYREEPEEGDVVPFADARVQPPAVCHQVQPPSVSSMF